MKGPKVTLTRQRVQDDTAGTPGTLDAGTFKCKTLELPWRDNAKGVSCIPEGTYTCRLHKSPRFGWVYWITNVPGRSEIVMHAGNFAGDRAKKLRSDVRGCVLVGDSFGQLQGQFAVLRSGLTLQRLMTHLRGVSEFDLEVRYEAG